MAVPYLLAVPFGFRVEEVAPAYRKRRLRRA